MKTTVAHPLKKVANQGKHAEARSEKRAVFMENDPLKPVLTKYQNAVRGFSLRDNPESVVKWEGAK